MKLSNEKLKALLEDLDFVSPNQLDRAYREAEFNHKPLGEVLVSKDVVTDDQLGQILADNLDYDFIDLDKVAIEPEVLQLVPEIMARKQKVIPFERTPTGIKLAMVNPGNLTVINLLEKKTGQPVTPYLTTIDNINSALSKYRRGIEHEFGQIIQDNISRAKKGAKAEDLPIVKIVDTLIQYAHENKASDIHIEPTDHETVVRFRIDGILHDITRLPKEVHELVATRIKIMSQLRTDEHRSAQDGKLRAAYEDTKIDIRISIVPIVEGEKIVMRLLSEKSGGFSLEELGFTSEDLLKLRKEYTKPYGMILTTGPTGSGKTTTLYAIIKILNRREVNIATIEDPVEYDMEGVNQIQVNSKTNLTFANGLRAILRQDPDIVMVGEIRDEETADIAINSAMTGHLVLTTLHTNDAPTALPRFLEMGIEPFLVASTVNIIIAQRLVRRICTACVGSEPVKVKVLMEKFSPAIISQHFGKDPEKEIRLYRGQGCGVCSQTGYKGRVGVFEIMPVSEEIRQLIMSRADADQILTLAQKQGMQTMIENGIKKALGGQTTIEEVLRATRE